MFFGRFFFSFFLLFLAPVSGARIWPPKWEPIIYRKIAGPHFGGQILSPETGAQNLRHRARFFCSGAFRKKRACGNTQEPEFARAMFLAMET